MSGALGHPAAAAARAEPPPLAREGHQVLAPATLAAEASNDALEQPAQQELSELPLDERRHPDAVIRRRGRAQEGLQVFADDMVEHGRAPTAPARLSGVLCRHTTTVNLITCPDEESRTCTGT